MAPPDADGHEEINFDTISNLTIKNGALYWKKQKLKTETQQRLVLSVPQKIAATVISVCVPIAAILTPVSQYVADLDKICPNTGYEAPFCKGWKARHDKQELKPDTVSDQPPKSSTPLPSPSVPAPAKSPEPSPATKPFVPPSSH